MGYDTGARGAGCPRIVAVSGGLGQPSSTRLLVDRLLEALRRILPGAVLEVVEVRTIAHDLLNAELTGIRGSRLEKALANLRSADGIIAVSPVFNAHAAAIFQMLWEVVEESSLEGVPVLLGATGGTPRHSLVIDQGLVPLFHYLHALVSPVSVFAATDDWGNPSALDRRVERAALAFAGLLGARGLLAVTGDDVVEAHAGSLPDGTDVGAGQGGSASAKEPGDDLGPALDFEQMLRAIGQ